MIIKKDDYVESSTGFNGNVISIDRKERTVRIQIGSDNPLSDLFDKVTVGIDTITKVYPKIIYVVDYVINADKENEDIIYDEYDNLRSARKRFTEVIKDNSNKYARICKRLSRNYEIIETIEEDY